MNRLELSQMLDHAIQQPTACLICDRLLDCPDDPLSSSCEGDCLGCIQILESRLTSIHAPGFFLGFDLRRKRKPRR